MAQLRKVLTSCPNLKKLAVESIPDEPNHFFGVPDHQALLEPGLRLPPINYLQLRGRLHLFDRHDNWDRQQACVNWEILEHLEVAQINFFAIATLPLKNLMSLTLSEPYPSEDDIGLFNNFIGQLPLLEHLSLVGNPLPLIADEMLERKGKSLKTLKLHHHVPADMMPHMARQDVPDRAMICRLGKSCPALETCAIDITLDHQGELLSTSSTKSGHSSGPASCAPAKNSTTYPTPPASAP
ncbi:MAG: hypothetical protein Q9169_007884 [Polycauliona sp. 2 TL-2023]